MDQHSSFDKDLALEKRKYFIEANGGISLQAAGVIYWAILGVAGFMLTQRQWAILGFFTSGLIFPLGLLLSKPLKSNLLIQNSLSTLVLPAMTSMFLSWPMIIFAFTCDVSFVPMFLAIGMALHWPTIGWMYNSKVCIIHAIFRVSVVTLLWYLFPNLRFQLLPITVSIIYLITIIAIKKELSIISEK